ncbi:hypothetical protein BMR05_14320 [Methylococcaceae bacterium HT4]|nr:hypothetical protein BMR05_14320 [Methylococcaceae bacterium HT4]TXL15087.1 hypothetical protein BMR06_16210 [Methylococcaceae bacterium HT5]
MFVNAQNLGEAISAVKTLQKASAQGQRIYHITQANQSAILGNIHHDPDTMNEIRNALNAGKEVITHTDAVSVPGWSGAGYIITDPVTGDGAYKIAGGGNGGYLNLFNGSLMILIGVLLMSAAWITFVAGFAIAMLGIMYIGLGYSKINGDWQSFYTATNVAMFFSIALIGAANVSVGFFLGALWLAITEINSYL